MILNDIIIESDNNLAISPFWGENVLHNNDKRKIQNLKDRLQVVGGWKNLL